MTDDRYLRSYFRHARALEGRYLAWDDPVCQSGSGRDAARWRNGRELILDAVDGDGDFLDVNCANGYLLESLVAWARERGVALTPFGVDLGPRLIASAQSRFPGFEEHFVCANAWEWQPARRFRYVYTLLDAVPEGYTREYVGRLLKRVVAPGGRLIAGAYSSRSLGQVPAPMGELLTSLGFAVAGTSAEHTEPATAEIAWIENR